MVLEIEFTFQRNNVEWDSSFDTGLVPEIAIAFTDRELHGFQIDEVEVGLDGKYSFGIIRLEDVELLRFRKLFLGYGNKTGFILWNDIQCGEVAVKYIFHLWAGR